MSNAEDKVENPYAELFKIGETAIEHELKQSEIVNRLDFGGEEITAKESHNSFIFRLKLIHDWNKGKKFARAAAFIIHSSPAEIDNRLENASREFDALLKWSVKPGDLPGGIVYGHAEKLRAALEWLRPWMDSYGTAISTSLGSAGGDAPLSHEKKATSTKTEGDATGNPGIILRGENDRPLVNGVKKRPLRESQYNVLQVLAEAKDDGLSGSELDRKSGHTDARKILERLKEKDEDWGKVILMAEESGKGYKILGGIILEK